SILDVATTETVADVKVGVSIAHSYDGDLTLTLIGPNGTRVLLSNRHGSSGDNYTATLFDDEAAVASPPGVAPFRGPFRPDGLLAALDGIAANGTWKLEVQDSANLDTGVLTAWSLTLATTGSPSCHACSPSAVVPAEVGSLTWQDHGTAAW